MVFTNSITNSITIVHFEPNVNLLYTHCKEPPEGCFELKDAFQGGF